jgi:hypothetical protein
VKADKDKLNILLNKLSNTKEIEIKGETNGVSQAVIVSENDVDLREELFYLCAENKMPILSMNFSQKTLEDIFIEMTKEYKAPEKKKRRSLKKDKLKREILQDELTDETEIDLPQDIEGKTDDTIENQEDK